jgi:hypothetical protein
LWGGAWASIIRFDFKIMANSEVHRSHLFA